MRKIVRNELKHCDGLWSVHLYVSLSASAKTNKEPWTQNYTISVGSILNTRCGSGGDDDAMMMLMRMDRGGSGYARERCVKRRAFF